MTKYDIIITILIGLLISIIGLYIEATYSLIGGLIVLGIGGGMIGGATVTYFSKGK